MVESSDFIDFMRKNFEEWKELDVCKASKDLNEKIGYNYFDKSFTQFFVGDFNSKLVMVHLNPKRDKTCWDKICNYDNFEDYFDVYRRFGSHNYGPNTDRSHKSNFDLKQVRFLKGFNYFNFKNNDKFQNLELVKNNKLQLELIPFGSPDFNYKKLV